MFQITKRDMRKTSLVLILLVLIIACNKQNTQPVNSEILNRKEMVNVLVDCYIVEAALLDISNKDPDNLKVYTKQYYDFVFKKHNINRNQLFNNIRYYAFQIKEFSKIYNDVLNKVTKMQTDIIGKQKKEE